MKKFFLFVAAALTSAAMFADPVRIPTEQQIAAQYDASNSVVLVVYFDEEVCNEIAFMGNYCNWSLAEAAEPYTDVVYGEPLDDAYEGWYVFVAPATPTVEKWENGEVVGAEPVALQAKPVQLKDGDLHGWDYQTGDPASWVHHAGLEMTITDGYDGEANIEYPSAGIYIYESLYFKNHNQACAVIPTHNYTVTLYAPECGGYKPAIIGGFNGWAEGVAMTEDMDENGATVYVASFECEEKQQFKFREVADTDWSNQIRLYNEESGEWYDNGNITLGEETEIVVDYSNGTWTLCNGEEAVENVKAEAAATKVIRDGQIVIIKGNATYNVLGAELK